MKQKKKPWVFLTGLCGILVFYLTVAVIAAFMVLDRIEAETNGHTTLFGTWWQTLLFIADIVCVCGAAVFAVLAVVSANKAKKSVEAKAGGEA